VAGIVEVEVDLAYPAVDLIKLRWDFPLSLRERAGVRANTLVEIALTLILSRGERGLAQPDIKLVGSA